jgi:hypothetical protein
MSAEDQLREEMGTMVSATGVRPMQTMTGVHGPETPEQRIAALEMDIQALHRGILLAGRQIDHLTNKISGS